MLEKVLSNGSLCLWKCFNSFRDKVYVFLIARCLNYDVALCIVFLIARCLNYRPTTPQEWWLLRSLRHRWTWRRRTKPVHLCFFLIGRRQVSSSFPLLFKQACPIIWGRHNGHRWFFAVIFRHPPSLFPVPPFSCLCPHQSSTLSSVFLFFQVASCVFIMLSACRHVQVVVF